jgi:hypothetical protein
MEDQEGPGTVVEIASTKRRKAPVRRSGAARTAGTARKPRKSAARAERLFAKYGRLTPEMERLSEALKGIPVDITPVYVAAGEK